jgi:hypothetical protein
MTREDFERISSELMNIPNVSSNWTEIVLKIRQIEVLEQIRNNLFIIQEHLTNEDIKCKN